MSAERNAGLSCSTRLVQACMVGHSALEEDWAGVPSNFWSAHPDGRVSLHDAHTTLARGAESLGDDQLGLKLGGLLRFGVGGAFDYAVRSAPTVRDSVAVAGRFTRLVADSVHFSLETWRSYAIIRVDYEHAWPKAVTDFAMSAFFRIHLAEQMPPLAQLACWFPYPTPSRTAEYEKVFKGAALVFGAPFLGFTLNRGYEDAPMPGADPVLHAIHCGRVESLLASLATAKTTTGIVQRVIEKELRHGKPTAERVARALHMSRRTMSRRLEQEGTDFSAEIDAVRRETALKCIRNGETQLIEIAFLSGFSHVESFHRAFRRWTGMSPLEYRNRQAMSGQPTSRARVVPER